MGRPTADGNSTWGEEGVVHGRYTVTYSTMRRRRRRSKQTSGNANNNNNNILRVTGCSYDDIEGILHTKLILGIVNPYAAGG